MNNTIEQNICDAVDILVNRAISQANFDKTISAIVVECVDEVSGKYKVRYQEGTYYATSDSAMTYSVNSEVYVLIPGGDFTKEKKIIGSVKNLGVGYGTEVDGDEGYNLVGTNVIDFDGEVGLCSYKKEDIKVLYDRSAGSQLLNIDIDAVNEYFKNSTHIIAGAKFKTNLPREQKNYGNYGLKFILEFVDDSKGNKILRDYIIDVDNMLGQPFDLIVPTRQIEEFEINGANFVAVERIEAFANNFPVNKEGMPDDIFIREVELTGAVPVNPALLNSYYLSFITPQGTFFGKGSSENSKITLKAEAKYKGKVLQESIHKMEFYWFREHTGVDSRHRAFCSYGGQGWECLNDYNIIDAVYDEKGVLLANSRVEWISGKSSFEIIKKNMLAKEAKYKCVCVYNGMTLDNEIIVKNYDALHDVQIVSSNGTKFYYDKGETTLTCKVDNEENLSYNYYWIKTNNVGTYEKISSDELKNEEKIQYETLRAEIVDLLERQRIYKEQRARIDEIKYNLIYEEIEEALGSNANYSDVLYFIDKSLYRSNLSIEDLNKIPGIAGISGYYCYRNRINNLPIKTITNYAYYTCSVFDNKENFLGTASIKINNSFEEQIGYTLIIDNGTQLFKYNEVGLSPAHQSNLKPQEIKTLSFTLFDENGNIVEEDDLRRNAKVTWKLPAKETLLLMSSAMEADEVDENYKYFHSLKLGFDISPTFNVQRNQNDIELEIIYQGKTLKAKTDFTFLKEGNSGTNGTDFLCRIVPNIKDGDVIPLYPMITCTGDKSSGTLTMNYNIKGTNSRYGTDAKTYKNWFKVQLWNLNEEIKSGYTVKWSFLKNKYGLDVTEDSLFEVTESGEFSQSLSYTASNIDKHLAHVVKATVTYEDKIYTATLPLIVSFLRNDNYRVKLEDYSGFQYVTYSSDGTRPQYDSTSPFKLNVQKNIEGTWVDCSQDVNLEYSWATFGRVYNKSSKEWENTNLISTYGTNEDKTVQKFNPASKYDGQCVNVAVEGIIKLKEESNSVCRILIPIHYMLNRYGLSALNDWDGNSISIDKDGNGMILSPQVGAGKKEDDNSFTGILIGTVDDADDTDNKKTGLLGYSSGARSIFLDAETGKAEFGANGKGKIIIDPSSNEAKISSGNYSTSAKTGMEINLTTPSIAFGSGNFSVDKDGKMTAKGGGSIAGWTIGDDKLYKGDVGISSAGDYAFWAGNATASSALFSVKHTGEIKATKGTVGGWNIDEKNIYTGALTGASTSTPNAGAVRLSNGTFSAKIAGQEASTWRFNIGNKFGVTNDGNLHASGGRIAGWTIDQDSISTGTIVNDPKVEPETNAVRLCKTTYASKISGNELSYLRFNIGNKFGVTQDGTIYSKGAYMDDVHLNKLYIGSNYVTLSYASIQVVTGATLNLTKSYTNNVVFSGYPSRSSYVDANGKPFYAFSDYPSLHDLAAVTGGTIDIDYTTKSFAYLS